jgi:hypothetical protein
VPDSVGPLHVPPCSTPPEKSVPVDLLRSLAVFAEPPGDEHGRLSEVLGLPSIPTSVAYSDVFLFQLYPYASVHVGSEGMMGGDARERVAGFWSALGYTPPAEPDHIASLLALYVTLYEREVSLDAAERALAVQARRALIGEHLVPWIFAFLHRVGELASGPYRVWAELLEEALRAEWIALADLEDSSLPVHLRLAPPLPDPRVEGGPAFLGGLLAPVRTGVILTRADLGRIARDQDLGLRAGERRYAVENLLAQDAQAVLRALSVESRRQATQHRDRAIWLGESADFLACRAESASALLDELSRESEPFLGEPLEDAAAEAPR